MIDPNDNWAQVELYRWQHGHLPGDDGKPELPLSVPAGVRAMASAIEEGCRTGDRSKIPAPFNVCSVLMYVAKLLEERS